MHLLPCTVLPCWCPVITVLCLKHVSSTCSPFKRKKTGLQAGNMQHTDSLHLTVHSFLYVCIFFPHIAPFKISHRPSHIDVCPLVVLWKKSFSVTLHNCVHNAVYYSCLQQMQISFMQMYFESSVLLGLSLLQRLTLVAHGSERQ